MGHMRIYSIGDLLARYKTMRGFNVLHPMGWDAFGLPAENAAIARGTHPDRWTRENIANMKQQMRALGVSYDWDREVATCDPEYYRWNQWLFLRMHERGLVYRKPLDGELVPGLRDGARQRAGRGAAPAGAARTPWSQREIEGWFFRITQYADELLAGCDALAATWPERVLDDAAQLDRPQRRRARGLPARGPPRRGDGLHDAPGHALRRDLHVARARAPARRRALARHRAGGGGARVRRARRAPGPQRARGRRAGEGGRLHRRLRGQPAHRRAHPGLRGELRAHGVRHRRGDGGARARPARLRVRAQVRPAGDRRRPAARRAASTPATMAAAFEGDGVSVASGPCTGLRDPRGEGAHDRAARGEGVRRGARRPTGCATGGSPASATGARRSR